MQSTGRLWPWLLALAMLCAGALLAAKLFAARLAELLKGMMSGLAPPPVAGEVEREEAAAVVFGGQKRSDVVHCTVFTPPRAAPGEQFLVQVFAHLARQAKIVEGLAAAADPAAHKRVARALNERVPRETLLTFTLEMPGLSVNELHRRGEALVWRGKPESVQFGVRVPDNFEPRRITCTVRFYRGEAKAPVGNIVFMFDIVEAAAAASAAASVPAPPEQKLTHYKHAFVSYCSKDRRKVLPIYLGKRTEWRKSGITDFFDRKDIGAGKGWNEVIQENLDKCDLFVLFWSSAARDSEGVRWEINYALTRKVDGQPKPPDFDPLTIELPVPPPIPEGLESLNFDDELLYLIKAEETLAKERSEAERSQDEEPPGEELSTPNVEPEDDDGRE